MPGNPLVIPQPLNGLDENWFGDAQPQGTTPDCLNVFPVQVLSRRNQIASRPGFDKYCSSQISGTNPILDLASAIKYDDRTTYTVRTSGPALTWSAALPGQRTGLCGAVDQRSGNLYVGCTQAGGAGGINYLAKINPEGVVVWSIPIQLANNTSLVKSVELDGYGGIYVCITASGVATQIYKYIEVENAGLVQMEWVIDSSDYNNGAFVAISVKNGTLYVVENTATICYLHQFQDIDTATPTHVWQSNIENDSTANTIVPISVDTSIDGGAIVALCDTTNPPAKNGILRKFGPNKPATGTPDTPVWSYSNTGVGQAVVCADDGSVYAQGFGATYTITGNTVAAATVVTTSAAHNLTTGDRVFISGSNSTPSINGSYAVTVLSGTTFSIPVTVTVAGSAGSVLAPTVRKLTDSGTSVASVWATATTATTFKGEASLAVDAQGNVYQTIYPAAGSNVLAKLSSAGAVSWTMTLSTVNQGAYFVAVDPFYCDKDTKAEYVYIGGDVVASGAGVGGSVHKLRLVDIAILPGSPRSLVTLGVSNGNIVKFTTSGVSTPTGGSGALDATSQQVCSASGFDRILYVDGKNTKKYVVQDDAVTDWKATTAGQVPARCRLVALWSGRAVVAGAEDDPQNWYMSAVNDTDDWDFFPPVITPEQAISGNDAECGKCPDVITAIMPISDDLLLFGGDHTIWRMTGNPNTGGRFDLISEQTGVAFGRAWCKDPEGTIYFVGSRGGVYRMAPGGIPESISDQHIRRRMNDMDIAANKIRLEWDNNIDGMFMTITPYAGGATTHYFWYRQSGSWWPYSFAATTFDSQSLLVVDGDAPGDRVLLFGCNDGYVRKINASAKNDDSTAISSYCWFGPFSGGTEQETKLNNLRLVLTPTSDTLGYAVYSSDESAFTTVGASVFSGTILGGRNAGIYSRCRGMDIWLRLSNSTAGRAWAVEQIAASVAPGSRPRPRATNT